jgi:hypothetical protein
MVRDSNASRLATGISVSVPRTRARSNVWMSRPIAATEAYSVPCIAANTAR